MLHAPTGRPALDRRDTTDLFAGPGELRALYRECDWAGTMLGPVSGWRPALRTAVQLVLDAPGAMCLYVGPGLVGVYNEGYRTVLGAKHPDAVGRPAAEVWREIWPEIGAQYAAVLADGVGLTGRDVPFELARLVSGAAEQAWFDYALSPVRDEGLNGGPGAILGVLAVVSETTARVMVDRALVVERARLAEIVRIAPAFMAVLRGPDHIIELTNAGFNTLIGGRDVCGRAVVDALPEGTAQGFIVLLDDVLATGVPFIGREMPYRRPDIHGVQDERYADFVYQAIVEADGTRSGVFLHGVDVTEQVRARRDIERLLHESEGARAEAERANKAKTEFLTVMSHELRTPLNAIDGYAELMELGLRGPITTEQQHDLSRIRKSEKHLLSLINGVLNFAQIEARAVQYVLEEVPVGDVLATCDALTAPQLSVRGLHFQREPGDPTMRMLADRDKAQQIVLNLLSNAVKFTPRGGDVRVRAAVEGRWVRIDVEDTGVGIAQDQQARIFEPFVQIDVGLTRTVGGTGLGLAIGRELARGMSGDLTVESTFGRGSTFTLRLPVAG